ncbi:MAG: hypothetical protein ABI472_23440 [Ginsengibacter sp.]
MADVHIKEIHSKNRSVINARDTKHEMPVRKFFIPMPMATGTG